LWDVADKVVVVMGVVVVIMVVVVMVVVVVLLAMVVRGRESGAVGGRYSLNKLLWVCLRLIYGVYKRLCSYCCSSTLDFNSLSTA
jgi:hypothetical protein